MLKGCLTICLVYNLWEAHRFSFLPGLPIPDAGIQCSAKNVTLQISRVGSSPLLVDQSEP